jgi:hypothetical protein
MRPADVLQAASGRWPEILVAIGGISADQLCHREGPCPYCSAGNPRSTRFRWDSDAGDGEWFCSHCGGRDGQGGGGNGLDLLSRLLGHGCGRGAFAPTVERVAEWLGGSSPRSTGSPSRSGQSSPRSAAAVGGRQAFQLLGAAGQLGEDEAYVAQRGKGYQNRWLRWSADASPEEVQAAMLQAETEAGIWGAAAAVEEVEAEQPASNQATTAATSRLEAAISRSKPQKLEAGELLDLLRGRAQDGQIRYNTFSQEIEINGEIFEGAERFYLMLAEQGYKVGKELALDCLVQVAHENIYDPVVLYLEHVAATVERGCIDVLSTTYLRPEDRDHSGPTLYDAMLKSTLIGAVRRAFEPGCKHDTACVLMGDQGARKSSFWSALGGAFFSDSLGDISSKDDVMVLHRSWIMEWAELDHIMGRRHAGQIKSFLSQSTDLYRKPYAKSPGAFPRRGVIVGSTNRSSGFLQDDTGNRRFWVIPTTRTEANPIDTATLLADRDAIWSAAVHAYRNGEPNYLPAHLAQQVTAENECYQVENPWRVPIEVWLKSPANNLQPITSELLLTHAVQRPVERQSRADQMQVGNIMRELGYQKRRQSVDGVLKWVFFQP